MGLDDLAKKAGDALSSDKAEAISDKALDAAAGAAKTTTRSTPPVTLPTARSVPTEPAESLSAPSTAVF